MQRSRRTPDLEPVWKALASPIRRRMLDLLGEGPLTTSELAGEFGELSRFAVMQHLRVLEAAELVLVQREGRHRYNYFNPVPIQQIYDRWVGRYVQPWTEALVTMRDELEAESRANRK